MASCPRLATGQDAILSYPGLALNGHNAGKHFPTCLAGLKIIFAK